MNKTKIKDWKKYYKENDVKTMPWYLEGLDHDVEKALNDLGKTSGKLLDVGSGPGTQF